MPNLTALPYSLKGSNSGAGACPWHQQLRSEFRPTFVLSFEGSVLGMYDQLSIGLRIFQLRRNLIGVSSIAFVFAVSGQARLLTLL